VPEESNILINPRHPNAAALRARKVRKWSYDARLWSTSKEDSGLSKRFQWPA
jgi:hypothetical protein